VNSTNTQPGDRETLVRVAWYYYRDNLTQAQIAKRLHVSRATAGRLLDRARQTGVVTIEIDTSGVGGLELAESICARYGLDDVVIIPQDEPSMSGQATNSRLALEAAHYLSRYLKPGATIGVGWGDTVMRAMQVLKREAFRDASLVTLTGGIDAYTPKVTGIGNAALSDFIRFIPSPFLASSPEAASMLRRERAVTDVIELAKTADASLIGIGAVDRNATILQNGIVSDEQLTTLRDHGAVGDILGEWYDPAGRVIDGEFQQLRIGVAVSDLQSMSNVIAVAGGMDKLEAIRAALNGGCVNALITSEDVARGLLLPVGHG
jgi:lsr operon transcriptional repressor